MPEELVYSKLGKSYPKASIMKKEKKLLATINAIRHAEGNSSCAECGEGQSGWASVTLGVFICTQCSQIHRGLGAHISKVKSCMGTYIWCPDEIEVMERMGNVRARMVYCNSPEAPPAAPRSFPELDKIARDKYEKKRWYRPGGWEQLLKDEQAAAAKTVEQEKIRAPAKPPAAPAPVPQPVAPVATESAFSFINEGATPQQKTEPAPRQPDLLDMLFSFPDAGTPQAPAVPAQAPPPRPAQAARDPFDFLELMNAPPVAKVPSLAELKASH
eukprot:TRINITY_DN20928_c0_g1_i1.p1 TRINITY_DN20928_c0_g1~~TRINITY_DN20928_c0_g1_i1.p1  ORF type:complete len:287 (+),score=81.36 TRINITY_DN20928_c0_g1_i1:47-862(+)